ncbi:MAG: Inosine-uridine preferring nucleoside hydrolase [uncultured Thermoleophilia bacterium]|uniref:Inosine-uridine preferring nucleoside hydrolase n=1 Tax=uncultured Thermoleophilia bacterium TaxID=1497501 RepID=A0A6J4U009_9ACTN|nr:MAG: Inosine-uridine preferring nucleoside hydrolase [uncultured Thermoleophilia bacterium]
MDEQVGGNDSWELPRAAELVERLEHPAGVLRVVVDTDTDNEIDDQFAVAYALLSPERLRVEALYAAPFHNERSVGPEDGMVRSYDELRRVVERVGGHDGPVLRGSRRLLPDAVTPVESDAAHDLVERAAAEDGPLYVVAIGAVTNVASALLLDPSIRERMVVVWLGGNPTTWHTAAEFNLAGDVAASRVLFDSGVPLVHVPCLNVAEHLRTSQAELDRFVRPCGAVGAFLAENFDAYVPDRFAATRPIWDLAPLAWLVDAAWVPTVVRSSPILTSELTWSIDPRRHPMREAIGVDRDRVFADLFRKLAAHAAAG